MRRGILIVTGRRQTTKQSSAETFGDVIRWWWSWLCLTGICLCAAAFFRLAKMGFDVRFLTAEWWGL
ncbi:MAG: hypothetical protein AAFR76_03590 [Planctomycetota bacterium]